MRSLKFRAWDKEEKEYYYNAEHTYDFFCSGRGCYAESFGEVLNQPDRFIVEQYTGLKDKNSKEIYEGDIVKARWRRAKHAKLDTKGEIKFSNGWFYIDDDPDGQDRLGVPVHNCYNIEVIGNIHENPLLTEYIDSNGTKHKGGEE